MSGSKSGLDLGFLSGRTNLSPSNLPCKTFASSRNEKEEGNCATIRRGLCKVARHAMLTGDVQNCPRDQQRVTLLRYIKTQETSFWWEEGKLTLNISVPPLLILKALDSRLPHERPILIHIFIRMRSSSRSEAEGGSRNSSGNQPGPLLGAREGRE
ncbi:hypothetical protein N431DRAFT_424991 [Stipitochalara longipes BDJ]|nr:hypothetical protein N431DRAFT_424991 [Stipitochalara longipes BDJ]